MPSRSHQTFRVERPPTARVTKGTPLSVRTERGKPYSRNARSKIGRARTLVTEGSPWHVSKNRVC
jgi:hypothetical protein